MQSMHCFIYSVPNNPTCLPEIRQKGIQRTLNSTSLLEENTLNTNQGLLIINQHLTSLPPRGLGPNSRPEQPFVNTLLCSSDRCLCVCLCVLFTLFHQHGCTERLRHWRYSCQRGGAGEGSVCAGWKRPRKLLLFSGKESSLHRISHCRHRLSFHPPTVAYSSLFFLNTSTAVLDAIVCVYCEGVCHKRAVIFFL